MEQSKTLFVLADGGHARLVERSPETGDFVTFEELEPGPRMRPSGPPGRSFESATTARHGIVRRDFARLDKESFAAEVADRVTQVCREREVDRLCIAAPSRLVGVLKSRLADTHLPSVTLGRDLIRTPDHELARWLDPLPPP